MNFIFEFFINCKNLKLETTFFDFRLNNENDKKITLQNFGFKVSSNFQNKTQYPT